MWLPPTLLSVFFAVRALSTTPDEAIPPGQVGRQLTLAYSGSPPQPLPLVGHEVHDGEESDTGAVSVLEQLREAVQVMQTTYFEIWVGTWPRAIDWTRAVVNTHLVSTLGTFSKALSKAKLREGSPWLDRHQVQVENEINLYFSQNLAYYFGENAFRIRNEAYDDILWVVLGWLETVKFIETHSRLHFNGIQDVIASTDAPRWHGVQFISVFAHRARVFYDLAVKGWDNKFCNGGMVWNPSLGPYKNAITNELYIAASAGMYLYFPGDNNSSPFVLDQTEEPSDMKPYDPVHLEHAVQGYAWLKSSGMTNRRGLYVDGFHISDWKKNGTKCDLRDNMVYTYNQGVLLSGLRALWEGTGNQTYLEDGHQLVRNVANATAWNTATSMQDTGRWSGLGRDGILEDHCDAHGSCSQDGQTFKGIFFHHLALFCEPLPQQAREPNKTHAADKVVARFHRQSCKEYSMWVKHNAETALRSRDASGKFGMWWGANEGVSGTDLPSGAVDYRNNATTLLRGRWAPRDGMSWGDSIRLSSLPEAVHPPPDGRHTGAVQLDGNPGEGSLLTAKADLNDRGRGRTVETQTGGVAVLRCLWELLNID